MPDDWSSHNGAQYIYYFCSIPVIQNARAVLKQPWSVWWIQNEGWKCSVIDCPRWVIATRCTRCLWFLWVFFLYFVIFFMSSWKEYHKKNTQTPPFVCQSDMLGGRSGRRSIVRSFVLSMEWLNIKMQFQCHDISNMSVFSKYLTWCMWSHEMVL